MSLPDPIRRELPDLFWSLSEGSFSLADVARLEHLAGEYPAVRKLYAQFMAMCGILQWERTSPHRVDFESESGKEYGMPEKDESGLVNRGLPDSPSGEWRVEGGAPSVADSAFPIPHSSSPSVSPFFIDTTLPSPFPPPRYAFIDSPWFAVLLAGVIMGAGLGIAAMWKMPDHSQIASSRSGTNSLRDDDVETDTLETDTDEQPSSSAKTDPSSSEFPPMIGQITGMVDCQWSDVQTEAYNGASVPLGRKYALSAGLMEITYDTGAKVILQGPCTYEAESKDGGYLSVGKLTARVEKGPRSKAQGSKTAASSPQPLAPSPSSNSSLSTLPSPLFAVRTPTATVTDLGTDFGVEVNREGVVDVHVFEGTVEASGIAGKLAGQTWTMKANEAMALDPKTGASPKMCDLRMYLDPQAALRNSPQMRARTPVTVTQTDLGPTPDGLAGKLQPDDALQRAFAAGTTTIRLVSGPAFQPAEYADVSRLCDAQNDSIFHSSTLGTPQDYNRVMHMFFAPADAQWAPAVYDIEFGPRYKESRDLREIDIFHGPNATRSPYEFQVLYSVAASPQTFRTLAAAHNFTTRNGTLIHIACQSGRVPDLAALRLMIHPIELANGHWAGNSFAEIDVNFYPAAAEESPTP